MPAYHFLKVWFLPDEVRLDYTLIIIHADNPKHLKDNFIISYSKPFCEYKYEWCGFKKVDEYNQLVYYSRTEEGKSFNYDEYRQQKKNYKRRLEKCKGDSVTCKVLCKQGRWVVKDSQSFPLPPNSELVHCGTGGWIQKNIPDITQAVTKFGPLERKTAWETYYLGSEESEIQDSLEKFTHQYEILDNIPHDGRIQKAVLEGNHIYNEFGREIGMAQIHEIRFENRFSYRKIE